MLNQATLTEMTPDKCGQLINYGWTKKNNEIICVDMQNCKEWIFLIIKIKNKK